MAIVTLTSVTRRLGSPASVLSSLPFMQPPATSGAITGTLVYLAILESIESLFGEAESVSPGVLAYTAVGALYGAGFGLGIGALFWKDRWEPVSLSNIPPSFRVAPNKRFELGFSIPLRR